MKRPGAKGTNAGPSGILVLDKPEGTTSARVVAAVKNLTGARKAGHAGTLDPFATGVLVCCLNRATRLASFLLRGTKRYEGVMRLGVVTDTEDATGSVVSLQDTSAMTEDLVREAFSRYLGAYRQRPPVYSALKHGGVPLYRLARAGRPVQKEARTVHIRELSVLEVRLPEVRFELTCSAGTYVRTLCSDIGGDLGCGGHLKQLRRLESSGFFIQEALRLDEIRTLKERGALMQRLVPMAEALRGVPSQGVDDVLADRIRHGAELRADDFRPSPLEGIFCAVTGQGNLLAVLRRGDGGRRIDYCCVVDN